MGVVMMGMMIESGLQTSWKKPLQYESSGEERKGNAFSSRRCAVSSEAARGTAKGRIYTCTHTHTHTHAHTYRQTNKYQSSVTSARKDQITAPAMGAKQTAFLRSGSLGRLEQARGHLNLITPVGTIRFGRFMLFLGTASSCFIAIDRYDTH